MSWQAYVDSSLVGTGNFNKAAIFNAEGTSVWAATSGFQVKPEEIQAIVAGLKDSSSVFANGIRVQGEKYTVFKAEPERIYGRKGREGILIVKTVQAMLVGHHGEDVASQAAAGTIEGLAEYLKGVGY